MLRALEGMVLKYTSETTASQPPPEPKVDAAEPEAAAGEPKAADAEPMANAAAEPKDAAAEPKDAAAEPKDAAAEPKDAAADPKDATAEPKADAAAELKAAEPNADATAQPKAADAAAEPEAAAAADPKAAELVFVPITERVENIGQLGPARTGRSADREVLDRENVKKIQQSSLGHLLKDKENVIQQLRTLPTSKARADPNAKPLGIASLTSKENYADARKALKPTVGGNVPQTLLKLSNTATDVGAVMSGTSEHADTGLHINNDDLLVKITAIKTANSELGMNGVFRTLLREGYAVKYERVTKMMRENHLTHPA